MPVPLDKPRPKGKYDWDEWLLPEKDCTFIKQKDFPDVSALVFQQMLLYQAQRRGIKIITEKKVNYVNCWFGEQDDS